MYNIHKFNKVLINHYEYLKKILGGILFSNLVSNLNRRLIMIENEKTENGQALETFRIRNEDLKRKYEQLMIDNKHRIHVQEHIQEISQMKRLTG
mgnify:CR=1 FL=1